MIALSERIKLELRHRDPVEITELILDNSIATDIEEISNEYKKLRSLSIVNVGLTSLKNFPALPSLEKLDLSDNRISCGLEYLKSCPKINQLFLSNNKLRSLNEIKSLSHLPCLETLELLNCELSETENYRKKVFEMIPSLKYLDGYLESEEVEDSDYEYEICYESDEEDDDESQHHNNFMNKNVTGKRGKFNSKVNYVSQDDYDEHSVSEEYYPDDYHRSSNSDLYETSNLNYLDDYNETTEIDEDEAEDYQCTPPPHGSKYVPAKTKDNFRPLKRTYCYNDDYENSTKVYCPDRDSCTELD